VVLLAFRFINAVAMLGLQGTMLFIDWWCCWHLGLLMLLQGWACRLWCCFSLVVLLAFKFINAVVQGWDCRLWCC
jgi:hypothetical protein